MWSKGFYQRDGGNKDGDIAADIELLTVMTLMKRGRPEHMSRLPMDARAYVQVKSELPEYNRLVLIDAGLLCKSQ